jgi:hypothetical protein
LTRVDYLPADMGLNFYGFTAILMLTVSPSSSTMFSSSSCYASSSLQQLRVYVCLCQLLLLPCRHQPIPNPLPADMGPNFYGYIAIFTLTVSLISSTMFSEAVWQRVWASTTPRALYGGAVVGFVSITCIVFLSGFGGWLAFVWGYASFEAGTNPNTYLMQVRVETSTAAFELRSN